MNIAAVVTIFIVLFTTVFATRKRRNRR